MNLGNPTALQLTGSMTVSAWIYATAFPSDDAAVVSKRTSGSSLVGFQLDTTVDKGTRTIGFKLTNSSGGQMFRYGATTLQTNTWYYVTGVYNAASQTIDVYLNGQLDNGVLQGTVTASQQNSTANVTIGRRAGSTGFRIFRPHRRRPDRQSRVDAAADPNRHGDAAWCRARPRYGCAFGPDRPRSDPCLDNANQSVLERLDRQCRRHRLSGVPQRPANCDHDDDQLQQHRADTRDDLSVCRQGLRRGWKHVRANYSGERDDAGAPTRPRRLLP